MAKELICENRIEIDGKDVLLSDIENANEILNQIFTKAMENIGFKKSKQKNKKTA